MAIRYDVLKAFIEQHSTQREGHVVWTKQESNALECVSVPKEVGLPKGYYRPHQLFWILQNQQEGLKVNTNLSRTCEVTKCINHHTETQYNLNSVVEMESFTYMQTCDRFELHCSPQDVDTGCINWTGCTGMSGYGRFSLNAQMQPAHRVAWELANCDEIPENLIVRHLCKIKNKLCVNPDHLTIGTQQQNSQDEVDGGYTLQGSNHPRATISDETAQKIIDSFGNGKTVRERAIEFEVSGKVIACIDTARSWRHIMMSEQIKEREAVVRRAITTGVLSDEVIQEIKTSLDSSRKCAPKYNIPKGTVERIRNGTYKSSAQRQENAIKNAIDRLAKEAVLFIDPVNGMEHLLFKGDKSQDPASARYRMQYLGKSGSVARVSFMAHKKLTSLPADQVVRHKCVFKNCINIDCLEIGTQQDNADDRFRDNTNCDGEKSYLATIDQELAVKIKQTQGVCSSRIRALFFGVAETLISPIDCGRSWKHVYVDCINTNLVTELQEFAQRQPCKKARIV